MKSKLYLFVTLALIVFGCKTTQQSSRPRPQWIADRPANSMYYIGIGIASKTQNPNDYPGIAKRNALNDLISEIKVTVSSNSILSQFQSNTDFRQQFESDTRLSALNTIEEFEVVDSWESEDTYWVYYRLSKDKYNEIRRRKMNAAIERAEGFYQQALNMDIRTNYMLALRTKIKAIASLQEYLSENIETNINGKQVNFVSELINSIQQQLYLVKLTSTTTALKTKVGKPIPDPVDVSVRFDKENDVVVAYMPIKMIAESGKIKFGNQTQTDPNGIASFSIVSVQSKDPVQSVRITPDIERIIRVDSLNQSLLNILSRIDAPSTIVRVHVEPIKVFLEGNEKNFGNNMQSNLLEAIIKKELAENGCHFVKQKSEADYTLKISSDTKSLGPIWGKMQSASLDATIILSETKNDVDVFKDALHQIKGFQTTIENAGIDAYKVAGEAVQSKILPRLIQELHRMH